MVCVFSYYAYSIFLPLFYIFEVEVEVEVHYQIKKLKKCTKKRGRSICRCNFSVSVFRKRFFFNYYNEASLRTTLVMKIRNSYRNEKKTQSNQLKSTYKTIAKTYYL